MPENRSKKWYVQQYNRNRDPIDWINSYEQLIELINVLNLKNGS